MEQKHYLLLKSKNFRYYNVRQANKTQQNLCFIYKVETKL